MTREETEKEKELKKRGLQIEEKDRAVMNGVTAYAQAKNREHTAKRICELICDANLTPPEAFGVLEEVKFSVFAAADESKRDEEQKALSAMRQAGHAVMDDDQHESS